ncbi:hypothetical protein [Streptomyces sp. NPDC048187]|uniref:hypothetical protein n=1 Tax=Streptomyces sp. NPDC048187 TaxID=3365509 RepID=UPI00371BBCB1
MVFYVGGDAEKTTGLKRRGFMGCVPGPTPCIDEVVSPEPPVHCGGTRPDLIQVAAGVAFTEDILGMFRRLGVTNPPSAARASSKQRIRGA